MQAALQTLGNLNPNDRIKHYISSLATHNTSPQALHDTDCCCRECERHQVLGLRKSRRKVPRNAVNGFVDVPPEETVHIGVKEVPVRKPYRRRAEDENGRHGESKLGRVAGLRPGRITIGAPLKRVVEEENRERKEGALRPRAGDRGCSTEGLPLGPLSRQRKDDRHTQSPLGEREEEGNSSWDSDEHSLHSNIHSYQAKYANPPPTSAGMEKDAGALFDDFYSRNPAAIANGWLALPHHRDAPAWANREEQVQAIDQAARSLLRPRQAQLVGLVPLFKSPALNRRVRR